MGIEIDNDHNEIKIDGYEYANAKVKVKSYSVSSETSQTENSADLRLTGSDTSTDNVTFSGGTNVTVVKTDANKITISASANDTNTTYGISAEANATPKSADIRLTGSDSTTDNLTLIGGTNVTVTRNDANTITLSSLDTSITYGISAESNAAPKSVDIRLTGSNNSADNLTLVGGTNVTVTRNDANTITLSSLDTSITYGVSSENSQTGNSADLRLTGSDSTTDNLTFTGGTAINVVSTDANKITISNGGVTQAVAGTGISVSAGTGSVTIGNTGVTAITQGTGIVTSGSGNITVTNDGVTTFNTAKGAITYNSFGTMSDGTNTAVADLANDTFSFVPGAGIGVLVSSGSDNITISNTGVTAITPGTGITTSGSGNITVSMSEASKILSSDIPINPTNTTPIFTVSNLPATPDTGSVFEFRSVIMIKFATASINNTIDLLLATNGSFTNAAANVFIGPVTIGEITSGSTFITSSGINDTKIHVVTITGIVHNGGTPANISISIKNNAASILTVIRKSFIKYNVI